MLEKEGVFTGQGWGMFTKETGELTAAMLYNQEGCCLK